MSAHSWFRALGSLVTRACKFCKGTRERETLFLVIQRIRGVVTPQITGPVSLAKNISVHIEHVPGHVSIHYYSCIITIC